MSATATQARPVAAQDAGPEEISQPIHLVTGPLEAEQLPRDSQVRVLAVTSSDSNARDWASGVFLFEACGAPVHLVASGANTQTAVLRAEEGGDHLLLVFPGMEMLETARAALHDGAHMVHVVCGSAEKSEADVDMIFEAVPGDVDVEKMSLTLLFSPEIPEDVWGSIAAEASECGLASVTATPVCMGFAQDVAQRVMSAPAVDWGLLVDRYNAALAGHSPTDSEDAPQNAAAAAAVAEAAELYAKRTESYSDALPLPMEQLVAFCRSDVKECMDRLLARLESACRTKTEQARHVAECLRRISRDRENLCKMNMAKSASQCAKVAKQCWDNALGTLSPELICGMMSTSNGHSVPVVAELVRQFADRYSEHPKAMGPAKTFVLDSFMRQKAPVVEQLVDLSQQEEAAQNQELRQALEIAEAMRQEDVANMMTSLRLLQQIQMEEQMHAEAVAAACVQQAEGMLNEHLQAVDNAGQAAANAQAAVAQSASQQAADITNNAFDELRNTSERMANELSDEANRLKSVSEGLDELGKEIERINKPKWWEVAIQWLIVAGSAVAGAALCVVGGPAGALVGGMLLSAGLSTGMKMAFNGGSVSWKEFGTSVGVGLATGLVSGGIGLGVGAIVQGAVGAASTGVRVVATHAIAQAAGGSVSSMAGAVIDNLAHNRKWCDGLGQAAAAGALTGFISGTISGVTSCREAAKEAAAMSKASTEQIAGRAAEAQTSTAQALGKAGLAFGESVTTGTVDGLLSAAFDPNVKLSDAFVMGLIGGCVSGAAGAAVAGARSFRERMKQRQAIKDLHDDGFLDASNVPTKEHDHSYLHHSATITEAEQKARITTGLDGTQKTAASGAFHDGHALKKVVDQAAPEIAKTGQKFCEKIQANPEKLSQLQALQDNKTQLQAVQRQSEATLNQLQSSGVSKHDKKTMGTLLGQLKKQKAALHAEINHANSVALAADTVTVGKPAGGGSWGSSMKNDNGVIKHLSNCKQAAINVKFEFGLVNGQVEVKTTSIASAYPKAAHGQKYSRIKLNPLLADQHKVAVQMVARNMAKAKNPENLPEGWATAVTPEGQRYFYNSSQNLVQWEHPYL